jgi:hypothetical protein
LVPQYAATTEGEGCCLILLVGLDSQSKQHIHGIFPPFDSSLRSESLSISSIHHENLIIPTNSAPSIDRNNAERTRPQAPEAPENDSLLRPVTIAGTCRFRPERPYAASARWDYCYGLRSGKAHGECYK